MLEAMRTKMGMGVVVKIGAREWGRGGVRRRSYLMASISFFSFVEISFIFRGEGRERNIHQLPLARP